jgi:hypothetical protein
MRQIILASFLTAILATVATSKGASDPLSPYLDSKTVGVIHFDISKVDLNQFGAWATKMSSLAAQDQQPGSQKNGAMDRIALVLKWMSDFRASGGKDIYAVFRSGSDGGTEFAYVAYVIVPLYGGKPEALAKTVNALTSLGWTMVPAQSDVQGNELVFSQWTGAEKANAPAAQPRPDLTDALASGRNAVVCAVLKGSTTIQPLRDTGIFFLLIGPDFSGAGPPPTPLDAITAFSFSLCAPPKESISWTFQCKDAKSAAALADFMNISFGEVRHHTKDELADEQRAGAQADAGMADLSHSMSKFMAAVNPKATGSRVTTTLNQDAFDSFMFFLMFNGVISGMVTP